MSNMKVFMTGATGLVGSHVLRLLIARGYTSITALRRKGSPLDLVSDVSDQVDWIDGDVTDYAAVAAGMKHADFVVHSAALISYQQKWVSKMHEVNVGGTANIVNAALAAGVQKLVHISSMAVFTRNGGVQHVDENTPWEETPYTSDYGHSKHLAEMEVWRGKAEGLNVSMVLPTIVMGSGFWKQGSSTMFYKAAKGLSFYPVGTTGFVDVRDLALLTILAMERTDAPERMIASGWNASLKDVLSRICELAGKKPPALALQPWQTEIVWRILAPTEWITGAEPMLSKSAARTTACKQSFDNSQSLSLDGFAYTPLDQTLREVMDNYNWAKQQNLVPVPMQFLDAHLA